MPRRTPSAVNGDGSPEPPCDGSMPVTCLVWPADDLHVLEAGAAVLGGDVVAAQVVDEPPNARNSADAVEVLLGPDDDALAAAVGEPGERGLVGHAAREPERVDVRGLVGVVLDEPTAAERRAEPRVVDRDDRLELRGLVELEVNFAEVIRRELAEDVHCLMVVSDF